MKARRYLRIAVLCAVGGLMAGISSAGSRQGVASAGGGPAVEAKKNKSTDQVRTAMPVSAIRPDNQAALVLDAAAQTTRVSPQIGKSGTREAIVIDAPMPQAGWTTITTEGFEGSWPSSGWTVTSDATYYGVPVTWAPSDYQVHGGTQAAWPHASAVDPWETYTLTPSTGYVTSWAVYGPFSLGDATDAQLTFYLSYDLGPGDSVRWLASTDGSQYYGYGYTGSYNWDSWSQVAFDLKNVPTLGNLCGQPAVHIAFVYMADSVQDYNEGAYIDDILLQKYTTGEHCYSGCGVSYDYGPFTPGTSYSTHAGSFNATGCRWYRFNLTAGNEYKFTFCEGGGTASGNTTLTLYDGPSCSVKANNDDACGTLSQITYAPTTSGNYYLRVGEFQDDGALTYTLAYKGTPLPCGIEGQKWKDLDRDGQWDGNESPLAGFVIYLDTNTNGQFDAGEPSDMTDANGLYQFTNLAAGNYRVFEVNQAGWTQTFPTGPLAAPGPSTICDELPLEELAKLQIQVQDSPPRPPAGYERATAATLPPSAVMLSEVPTSTWTYGCSATSAGMLFGYYDRHGYPNMYAGPANGGVAPLVNLGQGIYTPIAGACSIIATQNGFDGRATRGHVNDYWLGVDMGGPDPWVTSGWTEHTWGDCTADYMGTNQWKWDYYAPSGTDSNIDGATTFFYSGGSKLFDPIPPASYGLPQTELCHGMRLFAESRGYTVVQNYTQGIDTVYSGGFTLNDYKAEINAGRPVMIQLDGHTMVGVGYDNANTTIYIHDTWDNSVHTMTWGGSYSGMLHKFVTVIELASACPNTCHCVTLTPGTTATGLNFGNAQDVVTGTITVDPNPNSLNARWTLQGPNGYSNTSTGDQTLSNLEPGSYTLTWQNIACWTAPTPNPRTQSLSAGGAITFAGTYTAAAAPQVSSWAVALTHGTTEINSSVADGYVEPRQAGIKKLRVCFDQAMDTSATAPGYLSIVGDVSGPKPVQTITWPSNTCMVATLSSALPDGDRYVVTVSPNLQAAGGCPISGDRTVEIRALVGDVNGDHNVNVSDIVQIRDRRGQTVDANTCKFDVVCDNAINVSDIVVTRDCRGHTCP